MTPFTLRVAVSALLVLRVAAVHAQTPVPVETLFADAAAKEIAVRKALTAADASATVLKAVRTVVSDFERIVRQYPTSGYCDDALWRAARISTEAFEKFGDTHDRTAAARLFQALASEYPTSKLAKEVPRQLAALDAARPQPLVTAAPTTAPRAKEGEPAPPSRPPVALATIKGIRRTVLGDAVRVIIDLDMEVPFHDERLANPARVFVDLFGTRANPALIDQTIRFQSDGDIVRQVRVGRHPNQTTRIVLDADGVSSYSVYPLYSPYRLVIDCLRAVPITTSTTPPITPVTAPKPAPAPLPATAVPSASTVLPARRVALGWSRLIPGSVPLGATLVAQAFETTPTPGRLPAETIVPPAAPKPVAGAPSRNLAGGFSIARQLGLGVSRIVIDPGHGGYDPGAKGVGINEAELVLDISLRLEKLLAKLPGVRVVLTRRDDTYVSLQERTAIANRESADLFLSIHANANASPQARGVETYYLDFATNLSAASVAARENAASGQSMAALPDVIKTIALNNKLDESRDFATFVQRAVIQKLKTANGAVRDLGVKQAPFVVLIGAAMPSILAEVSFLTNAQEARLLKGPAYRQKIAEALFDGIRRYQASLKNLGAVAHEQ